MAEFSKPRGTADILPDQILQWQTVEQEARKQFSLYHFHEIRTPIFEHTEVFERGVGDTTDIVQKEMYTFSDRANRSITLRPEGTAGVVRAFVEAKMYGGPLPVKLFYIGPMFRYEAPQAGRFRQLHQYGVEVIGSDDPRVDAEVIELADRYLRSVGAKAHLEINSVGCKTCRARHKEALITHLTPVKDELCDDCQGRLTKNPLRILDCKKDADHPAVKSSPLLLDYLCDDCKSHFTEVLHSLDAIHLEYEVNPRLVRGLDYYTKTAFEFIDERIGAKSTILGGGRYNGLISMLGGPEVPGIGFAGGIERLLLSRKATGLDDVAEDEVDAYIVAMGDEARAATVTLLKQLRDRHIKVDTDYTLRGVKAQMKTADRLHAKVAIVIGDDELAQGAYTVRDLFEKTQQMVPIEQIPSYLQGVMRKAEQQ